MNKTLEKFARDTLKSNLAKCSEGELLTFKRMYSHGDLGKDINLVVDSMEPDKLDWAMSQVENTLAKK